ncbi:MAG: CBS domain-containing protein [Thaumarchaeota archaeon]|nr:CBS domain-containing protein [Candidatus Calditenuaceae archaeon]MDW8187595.1 CBS domain-containing protein [Nitrososphaerota archaeon]
MGTEGVHVPRLTVRDILFKVENVISGDQTVREAAMLMDRLGVGSILVESGGKLVGIVTERDLVVRVLATGLDHTNTKIKDIMSYPVIAVSPDTLLEDAVILMVNNGFRRLPVVDQEGKLIGIVTISEAARVLATTQKTVSNVFELLLKVARPGEEKKSTPMYG